MQGCPQTLRGAGGGSGPCPPAGDVWVPPVDQAKDTWGPDRSAPRSLLKPRRAASGHLVREANPSISRRLSSRTTSVPCLLCGVYQLGVIGGGGIKEPKRGIFLNTPPKCGAQAGVSVTMQTPPPLQGLETEGAELGQHVARSEGPLCDRRVGTWVSGLCIRVSGLRANFPPARWLWGRAGGGQGAGGRGRAGADTLVPLSSRSCAASAWPCARPTAPRPRMRPASTACLRSSAMGRCPAHPRGAAPRPGARSPCRPTWTSPPATWSW